MPTNKKKVLTGLTIATGVALISATSTTIAALMRNQKNSGIDTAREQLKQLIQEAELIDQTNQANLDLVERLSNLKKSISQGKKAIHKPLAEVNQNIIKLQTEIEAINNSIKDKNDKLIRMHQSVKTVETFMEELKVNPNYTDIINSFAEPINKSALLDKNSKSKDIVDATKNIESTINKAIENKAIKDEELKNAKDENNTKLTEANNLIVELNTDPKFADIKVELETALSHNNDIVSQVYPLISDVKSATESLNNAIVLAQNKLENKKAEKAELANVVNTKKADLQAKLDEIQNNPNYSEAKKIIENALEKTKNLSASSNHEDLENATAVLEKALADANNKVNEANENIKTLNKGINDLKDLKTYLDANNKGTNSAYDALLAGLNDKIKELENDKNNADSIEKIQELSNKANSIIEKFNDWKNKADELSASLNKADNLIQNNKTTSPEDVLHDMQSAYDEALAKNGKAQHEELEAITDKLGDEIEKFATELGILDKEKTNEINQYNEAKKALEDFKNELVVKGTDTVDYSEVIKTIDQHLNDLPELTNNDKLAEISQKLNQAKNIKNEVEEASKKAEEDYKNVNDNLATIIAEATQLHTENSSNVDLANELQELKNKIDAANSAKDHKYADILTTTDELNTALNNFKEAQKTLEANKTVELEKINDAKNEINKLKTQYSTNPNYADIVNALEKALTDNNSTALTNTLSELQNTSQSLTDAINKAKADKEAKDAEISEAIQAFDDQKILTEELLTQLSKDPKFDDIKDTLNNSLNTTKQNAEAINASPEVINTASNDLKTAYDEAKKQYDAIIAEKNKLSNDINAQKDSFTAELDKIRNNPNFNETVQLLNDAISKLNNLGPESNHEILQNALKTAELDKNNIDAKLLETNTAIQNYQTEISKINSKIAELEASNSNDKYASLLNDLRNFVNDSSASKISANTIQKINDLTNSTTNKLNTIDTWKINADSLEAKISEANSLITQNTDPAIADAVRELTEAKNSANNAKLTANADELQSHTNILSQAIQAFNTKLSELNASKQSSIDEYNKVKSDLTVLKTQLEGKQNENKADYSELINKIATELNNLTNLTTSSNDAEIKTALNNVKEKLNNYTEEAKKIENSYNRDNEALKALINTAQTKYNENQAKTEISTQLQNLQVALNSANNAKDNSITSIKSELSNLQEKLNNFEAAISGLQYGKQVELDKISAQKTEAQKLIDQYKTNPNYADIVRDLETAINNANSLNINNSMNELENGLNAIKNAINKAQTDKNNKDNEARIALSTFDVKKAEAQRLVAELAKDPKFSNIKQTLENAIYTQNNKAHETSALVSNINQATTVLNSAIQSAQGQLNSDNAKKNDFVNQINAKRTELQNKLNSIANDNNYNEAKQIINSALTSTNNLNNASNYATLEAAVQTLTTAITNSTSKIDETRNKVTELTNAINQLKTKKQELTNSNSNNSYTAIINDLQSKITSLESDKNSASTIVKLQELTNKATQELNNANNWKTKADELNTELNNANQLLTQNTDPQINSAIQTMQNAYNTALAKRGVANANDLSSAKNALVQAENTFRSAIDGLNQQKTNLINEFNAKTIEIQNLLSKPEYSSNRSDYAPIQSEITAWLADTTNNKPTLSTANTYSQIQDKLNKAKEFLNNETSKANQLKQALTTLDSTVNRGTQLYEQHKSDVDLHNEVNQLKQAIDSAKATKGKPITDIQNANNNVTQKISVLENKIQQNNAEKQRLSNRIKELVNQMNDLKNKFTTDVNYKQNTTVVPQLETTLSKNIQDNQTYTISDLNSRIKAMESAINQANSEKQKIDQEFNVAKTNYVAQNKKVEALISEVLTHPTISKWMPERLWKVYNDEKAKVDASHELISTLNSSAKVVETKYNELAKVYLEEIKRPLAFKVGEARKLLENTDDPFFSNIKNAFESKVNDMQYLSGRFNTDINNIQYVKQQTEEFKNNYEQFNLKKQEYNALVQQKQQEITTLLPEAKELIDKIEQHNGDNTWYQYSGIINQLKESYTKSQNDSSSVSLNTLRANYDSLKKWTDAAKNIKSAGYWWWN
ncbi:hypothetical protein [Mycoplasmopsis felifaucium]|uniref:hypothetical protein n=2 Tax=Mycoplasmopsis felifaucium TaxID=35768 RepID=UPI0004818DED|nr:hypothetical protein [Mycoplasmopsis felifaucium]